MNPAGSPSSSLAPDSLPLRLVTAADARFWRCAWQFLHGLERLGDERAAPCIVYDLGLGAERARLERRFPWVEFRPFDFAAHPPHVARRENFAWKPLLVAALLRERRGDVLWLDSATLLHERAATIHRRLRAQTVLTLAGQATVAQNCDARILAALDVPGPVRDARVRVGGVAGFCASSPLAQAIAAEWRDLALRPEIAEPSPGGSRHTYDQALLSIILHRRALAGELELSREEIDISSPAPARWLTSRNRVDPRVPPWADPLVRAGFRVAKTADQLAWRLRCLKATRVNGLHRWPKEFFRVFVQPPGRAALPVPSPRWSYYADPFLCRDGSRHWLFAEEFLHLEHRGRLVALPLDADARPGAARPLALRGAAPGHCSFPFVFQHDGTWHLVPETSANRSVDLFVGEEFPHRWRWQRRLLADVDAVDTTLLRHDGRWWLFTFAAPSPGAPRSLQIFFADDLRNGAWTAHPINAARRDAGAPFSSGRAAGPFVRTPDGAWLRPVQASARYYGEGAEFRRIEKLTPTEFDESAFTGSHPVTDLARALPLHHLAAAGDWLAYDVRLRTSYGQHVPLWRRRAVCPDPRALLNART